MITDHDLSIRLPPVKDITRSISFSFPATKITLPLANTVFHNGAKSTWLHIPVKEREIPITIEAATGLSEKDALEFASAQQDIKEAWDEMGELIKLIGQRTGVVAAKGHEIGAVDITIPSQLLDGALKARIPLIPLTLPRRIVASMGNILKQLEAENGATGGASRELEEAVQSYIDTLPGDLGTVGKATVFARLTRHSPTPGEDLLATPGARIHRVLSGGGGWGSKAGLLSLDPQGKTNVGEFAENFENSLFNAAGHPGEAEKAPTGLATPGQYVQFFVAAAPGRGNAHTSGIRFGAVPKVEDVHQGVVNPEERVVDGLFGGMAEEGVWVGDSLMDVPYGEVEVGVDGIEGPRSFGSITP